MTYKIINQMAQNIRQKVDFILHKNLLFRFECNIYAPFSTENTWKNCLQRVLTYQNSVLSGLPKRDMFNGAFEDKEPMLDFRKR
jgi:hypothetical protein